MRAHRLHQSQAKPSALLFRRCRQVAKADPRLQVRSSPRPHRLLKRSVLDLQQQRYQSVLVQIQHCDRQPQQSHRLLGRLLLRLQCVRRPLHQGGAFPGPGPIPERSLRRARRSGRGRFVRCGRRPGAAGGPKGHPRPHQPPGALGATGGPAGGAVLPGCLAAALGCERAPLPGRVARVAQGERDGALTLPARVATILTHGRVEDHASRRHLHRL